MKKIFITLLLAVIFSNQVLAEQTQAEINEKIAAVWFAKVFALEPKEQLTKLFADYAKYGNKHNLKKVQSFYDEKYVNSDGFDYKTYFELVKQTWDMYPDMTYTTEIQNISVNGDYAVVQTKETAVGNAKEPSEYLDDKGSLESSSEIVYYLKKKGNKWVIISDSAISEKTFLKFGDAKNVAFDVVAPGMIPAGEEYTIIFAADMPKDKILLGSITNEKITYPSERPKEVFRKLRDDGMLERVVRSNTDGYNEQAVVSVGVTKTEVLEEQDIKLSVSGVAFLMTRVNVVKSKNFDLSVPSDGQNSESNL